MEYYLRHIYPSMVEVASLSSVVLLLVGILVFKKMKGLRAWLLWGYLFLIFASETAARVTIYMGTKNNAWLDHLFTPLEYVLLAGIFYLSIHIQPLKKAIALSLGVVLIISVVDAVGLDTVQNMNTISKMVNTSFLVAIAMAYFYQTVNDMKVVYLDKDPLFLLSCGILIYKAGTSMSYALFNEALAISYDAARMCISVVLVLNILYYLSLAFIMRRMAA